MAAKRRSHSRQAGPEAHAVGPERPVLPVRKRSRQATGGASAEIARSVPFGISHVEHMANPGSRRCTGE
jgi:hypothetical protein